LHSRPIYYDDLIIKNYENEGHIYDEAFRKKYQNIFKWMASVTSSLMVAFTAELWYFKDSVFSDSGSGSDSGGTSAGKSTVNSFLVLGVIGGLLRIYYSATMLLGNLILTILKWLKKREQERLRRAVERRTIVELSSVGVTIGDDDDDPPLLRRSASCTELLESTPMSKMGGMVEFKPTLMTDIFN